MATPEPLSIDAVDLQARLDRLPAWFGAQEFHIDTAPRVAGFFWMDEKAVDLMIAGDSRINTDGIHFFDKQSVVRPVPPQYQMPAFQTSAIPYFRGMTRDQMAAVQTEQRLAGHLASYGFFGVDEDLHRAFCVDPENGTARWFMGTAFGQDMPEPRKFCAEREVIEFQRLVAHDPNNPTYLNGLAEALHTVGRIDEAFLVARKAVELAPNVGAVLDTYGWILSRQGKHEDALAALEDALAVLPDHPIVLYHLGATCQALGDLPRARMYLERFLEVAPKHEQYAAVLELLGELPSGS